MNLYKEYQEEKRLERAKDNLHLVVAKQRHDEFKLEDFKPKYKGVIKQ